MQVPYSLGNVLVSCPCFVRLDDRSCELSRQRQDCAAGVRSSALDSAGEKLETAIVSVSPHAGATSSQDLISAAECVVALGLGHASWSSGRIKMGTGHSVNTDLKSPLHPAAPMPIRLISPEGLVCDVDGKIGPARWLQRDARYIANRLNLTAKFSRLPYGALLGRPDAARMNVF
jgi:hypothetical protein